MYIDEERVSKPGPSSLTGIIGYNTLSKSILTKEDVVKGNFIKAPKGPAPLTNRGNPLGDTISIEEMMSDVNDRKQQNYIPL